MRPGDVYGPEIQAQHDAARAVLVCWSKTAEQSEWVRSEADRARHVGKLIPVSLDGVAPPMPFDQTHTADLSAWEGDAHAPELANVIDALRAKAKGAAPGPRPSLSAGLPALAVRSVFGTLALAFVAAGFVIHAGGELREAGVSQATLGSFALAGFLLVFAGFSAWYWARLSHSDAAAQRLRASLEAGGPS